MALVGTSTIFSKLPMNATQPSGPIKVFIEIKTSLVPSVFWVSPGQHFVFYHDSLLLLIENHILKSCLFFFFLLFFCFFSFENEFASIIT